MSDQVGGEPAVHWKFAVKTAYLKAIMLAGCMEYAKPKALLSGFAESTLVSLLKKFMPELFPEE